MVKDKKSGSSQGLASKKHNFRNDEPIEDNKISDEDVSDSSEDEDEDEEGELATENIEKGINEVLTALRSNSEKLKDPNFKFFPEVGAEGTAEALGPVKREKPVYLKDYQRERLLNGSENAENDDDNQPSETYVEQQERVRNDLINQFHNDDDGEDGDLLTKRTEERVIPDVELPNPEQDAPGFLDAFISQKAWLPKKEDAPTYKDVVDDDEESEEFDDLNEKFENAYNFRYEDPEAAEIVSYARDQNTLRRSKKSSRQKKRDKERAEREKLEDQRKLEMSKLRKNKVSEVTDKLAQLQEALGEGEERVAELLSKEDLDGDFDTAEWDRRMQKLFDEEYYGRDDAAVADGITPVGEIAEDVGEDVEVSDVATEQHNENMPQIADVDQPQKLSRKDLKRKAEKFVEENQDLIVDETIKPKNTFRYRTVEPETFGLTSRDILLASDKDLNQYVGIKKLASYRDKARLESDRKRYSKKKRLRQWRKEVFGIEDAPTDELWEKAKQEEAEKAEEVDKPKKSKHKSKKRKHN